MPTDTVTSTDELLFLPLGGAGEIGMNLNLFAVDDQWLMVDLGVTFGDDTMPGVDVVMPDPAFIEARRDKLIGLVLTHAHEDHCGAVPHLWSRLRCPIYCSPFTASIVRRKLTEAGLQNEAEITVVPLGGRLDIGPFDIELITLTHSIPEPSALIIRTRHGTVLHTGDWKFDPTPLLGDPPDEAALRRIGDEGVLALIGDSTNVFQKGVSGSESAVRDSLIDVVGELENRVLITCFASNVARLQTLAEVAKATGREPALVGRSLTRMYEAARENGYLTDVFFLGEHEAPLLPRDEALIICTGSQGEPRAALSRIASGSHPAVQLESGDSVVFSSKIIPGNERSIGRLHDLLVQQNVRVIDEHDAFIHVSGHPCRDELAQMFSHVRPHTVVPVHGEVRHLYEHAALATACQVPHTVVATNGRVVRLAPGTPQIIDAVENGRLALDGERVISLDSVVLRERRRVMYQGSVVASLVVDVKGNLLADPKLTLTGLADADNEDQLIEAILDAIEDAVDQLPRARLVNDGAMEEAARLAIRRTVNGLVGKKPTTDVHLVRIED